MAWVSLCQRDELTEGEGKYVEIDGFKLSVYVFQGAIHVLDDICPHAGRSLSGGHVEQGCAVCPWHGWSFRLDNGEMPGAPGVKAKVYPMRLLERDGEPPLVQADLPIY